MRSLLVALLLLLGVALPAQGDILHLRGGRQLVGHVTEEGDLVTVHVEGGTVTLPRSRVERIERVELPADRARRIAAETSRDDAPRLVDVAEEAAAAGLPELASELFEAALRAAPGDPAVAGRHRAWHVADRVPPEDDAAAARLLAAVGADGHLLRTRHFRIAYQAAPIENVRLRATMLEATWREFHRFVASLGVTPRLVEDRLEALVFADHGRWAAATGLAPEALAGLDGIYVGHTGRVILYDTSTSPASRAALAQTDDRIATVDALLETAVADDPTLRARLGRDRDALLARRSELADRWHRETLSTTTHEACHQLAFATGLCRPDQPVWLIEGLATLFEPTEPERFLPTAPNAARLRDVREAWGAGRGGDLTRIVGGETFDAALRHGDVSETALAYAEAWSLVYFLATRHRAGLARYLAATDTGTGDKAARLAAFAAAFGDDLAALCAEWRGSVARL